ncbi:MAG: flippase [Lachnospira sp.]
MSNNLVKKNTVINIIKSLCSIIFPFITFPYISRTLLPDSVGKINFGNSIVSYFSLVATLGIGTYALKECSRNRSNREDLSKTASEIFSINICSTLFAYIALGITLFFRSSLDNYKVLIIIQSSVILFNTLGADWINSAMEDFTYITLRSVGVQVLSIILMFIFIHRPEDYLKYALISVISSSGGNILNIFYRKKYCDIHFTFKMNIKKHLPPILLFFSMILAQQIYVNSDITILGIYKGDYEVGLYSTSVKLYNIVNTVIASVSTVVWPQIAEAYKKHSQEDVNRLAKYSLNFILLFGLPCIIGINVVAKEIILLIAGEQYLNASTSLHILTVALLFSLIGGWLGSTNFLPNGKEKVCLIASSVAAVTNIILNFLLIPNWGLNAAAFTTAVSEALALVVLLINYDKAMKITGIFSILKGPVIGCVYIVAVSLIVRLIVSNSIAICLITIILSIMGYIGILVLVKDEFFLSYLRPIINKLKRG